MMKKLILFIIFATFLIFANAQTVYRCANNNGKTIYQDYPCESKIINFESTHAEKRPQTKIISKIKINNLLIQQVRVQHNQCKSGSYDHLEIIGPIGPDSSAVIERALEKLPPCQYKNSNGSYNRIIYLASPGGELEHGYRLGHMFRKNSIQTIIPPNEVCASACAVAFLGGVSRTIDPGGILLFHSPYYKNGSEILCPEKNQIPALRQYFTQYLGLNNGEFLFERTMNFCSQRGGWAINNDAAKIFGITTN